MTYKKADKTIDDAYENDIQETQKMIKYHEHMLKHYKEHLKELERL